MTKNQRKAAVAALTPGITKTEVGKIAYPKTKHPKVMGSRVLQDPVVKQTIQQALKDAGITVEARAEKLKELYDAEDDQGPLHRIQLETEKHVSDLMGDKAPSKNININVSEKTFIEKLKQDALEES